MKSLKNPEKSLRWEVAITPLNAHSVWWLRIENVWNNNNNECTNFEIRLIKNYNNRIDPNQTFDQNPFVSTLFKQANEIHSRHSSMYWRDRRRFIATLHTQNNQQLEFFIMFRFGKICDSPHIDYLLSITRDKIQKIINFRIWAQT